jgi:lipopolysaccharide transport system ATP-binding protein
VVDGAGITSDVVEASGEVGIEIVFEILDIEKPIIPWIDLVDDGGSAVFSAVDPDPSAFEIRSPGTYSSTAWIPEHLLNDGTLHVHVSLKSPLLGRKPWRHAEVESALTFQVVDPEGRPTARGGFGGHMAGPVRPLLRWSTHAVEPEGAPLLGRRGD